MIKMQEEATPIRIDSRTLVWRGGNFRGWYRDKGKEGETTGTLDTALRINKLSNFIEL